MARSMLSYPHKINYNFKHPWCLQCHHDKYNTHDLLYLEFFENWNIPLINQSFGRHNQTFRVMIKECCNWNSRHGCGDGRWTSDSYYFKCLKRLLKSLGDHGKVADDGDASIIRFSSSSRQWMGSWLKALSKVQISSSTIWSKFEVAQT